MDQAKPDSLVGKHACHPALKPYIFSKPTKWKERTDFHTFSSDTCMCTVAHMYPSNQQIKKNGLKYSEE